MLYEDRLWHFLVLFILIFIAVLEYLFGLHKYFFRLHEYLFLRYEFTLLSRFKSVRFLILCDIAILFYHHCLAYVILEVFIDRFDEYWLHWLSLLELLVNLRLGYLYSNCGRWLCFLNPHVFNLLEHLP
jgi:hypothetical protein